MSYVPGGFCLVLEKQWVLSCRASFRSASVVRRSFEKVKRGEGIQDGDKGNLKLEKCHLGEQCGQAYQLRREKYGRASKNRKSMLSVKI